MKSVNLDKNLEQDDSSILSCTALIKVEEVGNDVKNQVVKTETSPAVSRYGRTHKPKISEDFLPTDKKVGAILGLSPKSRPSLPRDSSILRNKAVEKGRIIQELLKDDKHTPARGRKPKLKLVNSEKKLQPDNVKLVSVKPSDDIKSEVSTSEKYGNVDNPKIKVEKNESSKNEENEADSEIMSPDVTSSVDDKILSEHLPAASTKFEECGWVPGDLAWARVGGHPFWPCMVATDPRTGEYTKIKRVGRGLSTIQRSLHVQFFGDNGRHSWVSTNCVIKFEGKDGLQDFADKVLTEIKKKDKKFSTAFVIRPSSKVQWDCAVQEAEEASPKTNEERIRFFEENFPPEMYLDEPTKNDTSVDEGGIKPTRTLKRKRNEPETDEKPLKQIKGDPVSNGEKTKEENDVNGCVQVTTRSKLKRRKRVKKEPYDFRIFAEKYSKHASEIHPGMNNESLQKLMVRMWAAMDESEKSIYKRERRDSSDESSSADEETSDDPGNDDSSSNSTRESTPSFAPSNAQVKKASGLFRGTRLEKVCLICLKPGNTVKCKGPCLSTFHVDCLKYPPVKDESTEVEAKKRRGRLQKTPKNEDAMMEGGENHCNDSGNEKDHKEDNENEVNDKDENKANKCEDENDNGEFRCKDCSENRIPVCFICNLEKDPKDESDVRVRCTNGHCGKFYHLECVKAWPQASYNGSSKKQINGNKNGTVLEDSKNKTLTCPQHVCHTCASDDPRNATMRFNHERLVRCIQCPTAYHTGNYCVPAGSEILTGSQIICPRHYEPPVKGNHHVNVSWCFICAIVGGSLICCDLCPTSFHAECLKIAPPEGGYICEDCDTGRYPLYGEVVWVKLGAYRWWPAQILFPNQIPDNVANLPHKRGEFAVKFFGSHDHYWVNRGRVFLYQEGDTGHKSAKKTSVDGLFQKALAEAAEAHKKIKVDRSLREAEARPGMKPPSYIRIKTNKPVGNVRVNEVDPSSMTPCECDPESKNPCGVDSDCLNRILMVECTLGVCAAGDRCGNQCFLKRQYPPLEPFRTESRGWGLRALKNLRKGEFVIEYVGEMIDEAEYRRRLDCKHQDKDENYYFLTIDNHRLLDAGPKGNVARFMNHSCQPNCETQKWTVNGDTRVGLFALQDIPMGEELTFNYNLECVGPDKKPCMCGAPNCSGYIGVKVSKLIEDDKKTKVGKQDNQRSAKKKKKRQLVKLTEGECFECGGGGELLLCDNKTCPKGYHLSCAKRKTWPKGKWLCPWHSCDICQRRTGKRCGFCPRSYCILHAEGNIRLNSSLGMVCRKHDEDLDKSTSEAYNEILEDVKICLEGIRRNESKDDDNKSKDDDNRSDTQNDTLISKQNLPEIQENPACKADDDKQNRELHEESNTIKNVLGVSNISPQMNSALNRPSTSHSSDIAPKKRGRPKKYPLSPPTLAQYKSPKTSATKTPNSNPKSLNGSTIKKKLGRPRKYPILNSPTKDLVLQSNNTPTKLITITPTVAGEKKIVAEDKHNGKLDSENILNNDTKTGSVSPRTSNRKRQPSEKLAAFMNSQFKVAKKRLNKTLETFVIKLERRGNDSVEAEANNVFNPEKPKLGTVPSSTKNKSTVNEMAKTVGNKMDKNCISGNNFSSIDQTRKSISSKSDGRILSKSHKIDIKSVKKPGKKSEKLLGTKSGKVQPSKLSKNFQRSLAGNNTSKINKSAAVLKTIKDESSVFKSFLKRSPKKTILQRVDHKPDHGKSIDSSQKALSPSSTNGSFSPKGQSGSTSKTNVSDVSNAGLYQKGGINGINDLNSNNSILESFDDNESQYFSENITTIPIKFTEFGEMKDEFLVGSDSPEEQLVESVVSLDSEFIAPRNEETTEQLSEDGKYQILTNMRPDSLGVEKQVLMEVES